jgi:hypothetical protein
MIMTHRAAQAPPQILRVLIAVFAAGCANHGRPAQPESMPEWMTPHVPWLGTQPRSAALVRLNDATEARYHMRMHFGDRG